MTSCSVGVGVLGDELYVAIWDLGTKEIMAVEAVRGKESLGRMVMEAAEQVVGPAWVSLAVSHELLTRQIQRKAKSA